MDKRIKELFRKTAFGIKPGLEITEGLLTNLGMPQNNFRSLHIAGTNGKGSVASYLNRIFINEGLKTALYTSPHLYDFSERIRINGSNISKERLLELFEITENADTGDRSATFFEFTTAMAFKYFSDENADIAVIETGMGGRYDSTNLITPNVSIITNISLEHTDFLGSRIEDIAFEKGGIIKPKVPVVSGVSDSKASKVLEETAREQNSDIYFLGEDFTFEKIKGRFILKSDIFEDLLLSPSMEGEHQIKNAATAAFSCLILNHYFPESFSIKKENIEKGITEAKWRGRLERVSKSPEVIIDCAHNPDSMRTLHDYFAPKKEKITFLFGSLKDKDYEQNLKILEPVAERFIFTSPDSERSLDPEILSQITAIESYVYKDPIEALHFTLKNFKKSKICIAGSIYLAGIMLKEFDSNH